jgi:hypothetical protein
MEIAFLLDAPTAATSRHQIARLGSYADKRYGNFGITSEQVASWQRNLAELQNGTVAIDYDHASDKPGGSTKAAGWISNISIDGDKVLADVEWTPDGKDAVAKKYWRYFSPTFVDHYKDEQGKDVGPALIGTALTNRPFLRRGMPAINLSAGEPEPPEGEEEFAVELDFNPSELRDENGRWHKVGSGFVPSHHNVGNVKPFSRVNEGEHFAKNSSIYRKVSPIMGVGVHGQDKGKIVAHGGKVVPLKHKIPAHRRASFDAFVSENTHEGHDPESLTPEKFNDTMAAQDRFHARQKAANATAKLKRDAGLKTTQHGPRPRYNRNADGDIAPARKQPFHFGDTNDPHSVGAGAKAAGKHAQRAAKHSAQRRGLHDEQYVVRLLDAADVPNDPGKTNWVEKAGNLPRPIADMAGDLITERGFDTSRAIATAVSQSKKLAAKGNAKYVKAVAQWERMKASAHAHSLASDSPAQMAEHTAIALSLGLAEDASEDQILDAVVELRDSSEEPKTLDEQAKAEGKIVLDAAQVAELQLNANSGKAAAETLREMKFDTAFDKALSEGRVNAAPETRELHRKLYDADEESALTLLSTAPQVVTLGSRGHGGGGVTIALPPGHDVALDGHPDEDQAELHERALSLSAEQNIDYLDAVIQLSGV